MALILKPTFEVAVSDGSYITFKDMTGPYAAVSNPGGYGSPNPTYSDARGVRIKIATYSSIAAATNPVDEFIQYKEYRKIAGGVEQVDNKYFTVGDVFAFSTSGLACPNPDDWIETGYIVYPVRDVSTDWRPDASFTPKYFSPASIDQTGTTIEDDIYLFTYEVYAAPDEIGNAAVPGQQYIVVSASSSINDFAQYINGNGANLYTNGEIFTASNTNTITSAGGSPSVYALNAVYSGYAVLSYNLEYSILNLISECQDEDVFEIIARLKELKKAAFMDNISTTDANNILIDLENAVQRKLECC